jgi:hypothetical protein
VIVRPLDLIPSGIASYLSFPGHAGWSRRYAEISSEEAAVGLLFTQEFKSVYLPGDGTNDFEMELFDSTDGSVYRRNVYVAYEDDVTVIVDGDGNCRDVMSLHGYFYAEHYCPCNRKLDAQRLGAVVLDEECEGDRFRIRSITHPGLPGLVLYSETVREDELTAVMVVAREDCP